MIQKNKYYFLFFTSLFIIIMVLTSDTSYATASSEADGCKRPLPFLSGNAKFKKMKQTPGIYDYNILQYVGEWLEEKTLGSLAMTSKEHQEYAAKIRQTRDLYFNILDLTTDNIPVINEYRRIILSIYSIEQFKIRCNELGLEYRFQNWTWATPLQTLNGPAEEDDLLYSSDPYFLDIDDRPEYMPWSNHLRNLSDHHLKLLSQLKWTQHIKYLRICPNQNSSTIYLSDEGLKNLQHMASLKSLSLSGTRIDGSGLHYLTKLPNLKSLYLHYVSLNNTGFLNISKMPVLEQLCFYPNDNPGTVTEKGLLPILTMKTLERLEIGGCDEYITEEAEARLSQIAKASGIEIVWF